ncbi:MAG: hypothetical protein MJ071_00705 [Oscillospiraceae bacterium]|nr:hypothetical protein [Oscillospiraceae bacterium]
MSNSKIRHWIYLALGFLILVGIGNFALFRDGKYDEDQVNAIYAEHADAYHTVASYLKASEITTRIEGVLSIDAHYGVRAEDTNEYRAFEKAVEELIHADVESVVSSDSCVKFILRRSGGILNQSYLVFAEGDVPPTDKGTPCSDLKEQNWYYYLHLHAEKEE